MNLNIQNAQDYLAEQFSLMDNHLIQSSKIAFLKIQSWKFSVSTPEVGPRYQQEAEEMVRESFFSYVPNTYILSEEKYYFNPVLSN